MTPPIDFLKVALERLAWLHNTTPEVVDDPAVQAQWDEACADLKAVDRLVRDPDLQHLRVD